MRRLIRPLALALSIGATLNYAAAQPARTPNQTAAPAAANANAAVPAAAPAAPAPMAGIEGNHNTAYTDRIPADQIVALDAGGDKFQGWHIADLTGQPRGAVIVLPDSGHLPSWPFTAAALIDDLPLHGWDTLNIELPVPAAETLKAETTVPVVAAPASANNPTPAARNNTASTTAPAAAATANATPAGIEPQAQARINAAIKYFTDQNQRNIVLIGFGSGAIRAADTLQQIAKANTATAGANAAATTAPITALVMIAPQQRLSGIDMDLAKLLPLTATPALDITLDSTAQTRSDAEARRRAVLHQRARVYTQLELPPINNVSDAQHSALVKRVRTWLQMNAHPQQKPTTNKPQSVAPSQP